MIKATLAAVLGLMNMALLQHTDDARAFYPARPGDSWTYESSARGRFTNEVTDTVVRDGLVLARLRSTDASGQEHRVVARFDGPRLYLGPEQGSQPLIADFSLQPGASVRTENGTSITVQARHASLDVFGTTYEDVVEVQHASARSGSLTYFFARGIGMVGMRSDAYAQTVRLVTAQVGGRTINAEDPTTR